MAKRRCCWCNRAMPWWSKLFGFWTCNGCAERMSLGGSPLRWTDDETVSAGGAETSGEEETRG